VVKNQNYLKIPPDFFILLQRWGLDKKVDLFEKKKTTVQTSKHASTMFLGRL